ncbi:MAG: hypothetical protein IIV78_02440 [Oscillospiraceae bacterium]|nr:hypothetical protein [Oscillospiraceae bacterium]
MGKRDCLRCGVPLGRVGRKKFQLGETGWILGDLPNLLAGSLELDIFACPECGSVEFFRIDAEEDGTPTVVCPNCGRRHDFDYPKCPFCKHDYYGE